MDKSVVLSFGNGDLLSGFPTVTAQLWEQDVSHPIKFTGSLPADPSIPVLYKHWQILYLGLYQRLDLSLRIEIEAADVTNVSEVEFVDVCDRLSHQINLWLNSESFRSIDQQLRTHLNRLDELRVIIETNDDLLQRLPWHLWHFLRDYPKAEVALSACDYQRPNKNLAQPPASVRILAVLGDGQGIDIHKDRAYLEQLSTQAEIKFLVEPTLEELNEQLWQSWSILFFAGHSSSQKKGLLQLNRTHALTLEQLKYGLQRAIAQGLKLAIFNSCDGLGLAKTLADLHIPQMIVMRESVPDIVAQKFLKYFLTAFSKGQFLYAAVREAREKLQGLEHGYPCATWLPVLCQNPAEMPITWQSLCHPQIVGPAVKQPVARVPHRKFGSLKSLLFTTVCLTALTLGIRYFGVLQPYELQSLDQLMRLRPAEAQDPRLLLVTLTEEDYHLPEQQQRKGSLSDLALVRLLKTLTPLKPRAIGLDIYHDFPVHPDQPELTAELSGNDRFFAICKVSDRAIDHPGIAPPPQLPKERQGFSDIVEDPDGIVRRHLVAMNPSLTSPCTTPYALSIRLALHYLQSEGITARYTADGQLQLGPVTLKRLRNHMGGYQAIDTWGYQILLNYRSHRSITDIAQTISLEDALKGALKPDDVRDRVVLIGVTAPSAGDYLATPGRTDPAPYRNMPGVVAQAQMVSQLISAVEDGRPLLLPWPFWREALWVWSWALVGAGVTWRSRSGLRRLLSLGLALGCLLVLCFYLLIQGWWVPLVPAGLALALVIPSVVYLRSLNKLDNRIH